jgi:branched-chain amino acid transport system permease protein
VLGAAILTVLQDYLQTLLPKLLGSEGNFEIIVFGVLMVVLLQYARQGVAVRREAVSARAARHAPEYADPLPQRRSRSRASRCSWSIARASNSAGWWP